MEVVFGRAATGAAALFLAATLGFAPGAFAQTETADEGAQSDTPSVEMVDPAEEAAERGAYVFRAGGCYSCHTDTEHEGAPLAGGRALVTPFGTFYSPNISPDPEHGIGGWTDVDFVRALRHGVSPDGDHYFPAFPYPAYTGMTDRDMVDLKAYLMTLEPQAVPNKDHDVAFPFGWRPSVWGWKQLYFTPGTFQPDPSRDAQWNRGAYLVRHLAHCGECHTPRDLFGGRDDDMEMAGTKQGPDNEPVPNITPDSGEGIGGWSREEVIELLKTGFTPEFDVVSGAMGEVVEHGTSHLTDADLQAIAVYLESVEPVPGDQ